MIMITHSSSWYIYLLMFPCFYIYLFMVHLFLLLHHPKFFSFFMSNCQALSIIPTSKPAFWSAHILYFIPCLFTVHCILCWHYAGFAYPATEESIMELQTSEEFYSCDLSNPIRMYTNGLDKVSLDREGIRFFTSGNLENCKTGLKLPVNVQPPMKNETLAAGPTTPSASAHFTGLTFTLFVALALSYKGI